MCLMAAQRRSIEKDKGTNATTGTKSIQSHAYSRPKSQPSDLLYLHNWPSPSSGAVVMIDVISSSLGVLPLLPSGGQAGGGQGVGSCRGGLIECGETEQTKNSSSAEAPKTQKHVQGMLINSLLKN